MNSITGENLRKLREKRNITQLRLASEIGISQESVSHFESNGSNLKLEYLVKIADFLNTSVDYILGRTTKDEPIQEILSKITDKNLDELLNNYAQLNNLQRQDLIWYSDALKNKKDQ